MLSIQDGTVTSFLQHPFQLLSECEDYKNVFLLLVMVMDEA